MSFETSGAAGAGKVGAHKAANVSLDVSLIEAEARYARERYQLYKAKAYGPRPTSSGRLRALEQRSKLAERRLDRARADQEPVAAAAS